VLEVAIVFPAVLFLIMSVVQFALWYHGAQVFRAAAQDGARAAQVAGASDADGRVRAEAVLGGPGSNLFRSQSVTASRQGDVARVTVTGRVVSLVGFGLPAITRTAEGPVDRFRSLGDR
jgi:hypothetical protein